MSPQQLMDLLSSVSAADVVEAIDSPDLQRQKGWDLWGWRYEPVPWGVRFLRGGDEFTALVAGPWPRTAVG